MSTQIFKSWLEFHQREDKKVNGVSEEFAKDHPDFEKENETNEGCWNCSDCSRCSGCSDLKNASPKPVENNILSNIPVIENIHQKVYEAATVPPEALDMEEWHSCETTHCCAGWVVHLAGKAGYELEKLTSTPHAAMQIYHKSCPKVPVSPVRFYESNEVAIADMKRCAEEEANLTK